MATTAGVGVSTDGETRAAASAAVRQALATLRSAAPAYGVLFASPKHDLRVALDAVRSACVGVPVIGCTTAGEITSAGMVRGGVVLLLVAADVTVQAAFVTGLKEGPERVANDLLEVANATKKIAGPREHRHLTTILLTDGLAGTGEKLVNAFYALRPQAGARLVGGAAGDDGEFKATLVGAGGEVGTNGAAALHLFRSMPWGVGIKHGLRPTSKAMRVTRATDNVVAELDGQPAFAAYQRHAAARGVQLTPESAGPYLIANELGIHFFDKVQRARAPLSVGTDGSLRCAGDIPKGSLVSILDGEPDRMVEAANGAAQKARDDLNGHPAAAVLLFDCVCRGMILKDQFHREVSAVQSVFPNVPIAGFLTYGEIARHHETLDGWHNTTAVVVAIPA